MTQLTRFLRTLSLALILACLAPTAIAGTACNTHAITPEQLQRATTTAMHVRQALDASDAPVAMIARVGTDLSEYGLHYSHVGFAVREHEDGPWTVVHLLNQCGSPRAGLYAQGLVNFFADDLISYEAKIVYFEPEFARALAAHLRNDGGRTQFEPRYNVIARYDSKTYQNSTAWALEQLIAASMPNARVTRGVAHQAMKTRGFQPDIIDIPYSQRVLGGLFSANTVFTDHSVGARLSGHYAVVTVRAILRFARDQHWIERERVLDEQGEDVLYQGD